MLSLFATPAILRAAEIGPFTGPEADAEAARLYERANDYVNNVVEGKYSYAYMQFYWKRAGANIDRILQAYLASPTARKIKAGELKLGAFPTPYFKERVLPRLEEKKQAAYDAVQCAIFLYDLENNQDAAGKQAMLGLIIETLCRQQRWGEALAYPVLETQRQWLRNIVLRLAAVYHNDKLADELFANTAPEIQSQLLPILAESYAFRGNKVEELEDFLSKHDDSQGGLRAAAFAGLIRRQRHIDRALQQKRPLKGLYDGVDLVPQPEQSVDLGEFFKTFGDNPPAAARQHYGRYLAFLGRQQEALAVFPDESGYLTDRLDYLVSTEQYREAMELVESARPAQTRNPARVSLLFLLAWAGREEELSFVRQRLEPGLGELPAYAEFRGRIFSTDRQLVVREHTLAELPLSDPNFVGRIVCEHSLTPNRTLRGATPWDAVVCKFAPGFENLPPPQDKKKVEAAGR